MVKRVLSTNQKNRIYQLYFEDGFSQSKIANLYDVSQGTISNIVREKISNDIESGTTPQCIIPAIIEK